MIGEIVAKFGVKAIDTKTFVLNDEYFKQVENVEKQVIQSKYNDLVDWLMFYLELPASRLKDSDAQDDKSSKVVLAY